MSTATFPLRPEIPADLRIPPRPRVLHAPLAREPLWREAMRWSTLALSASLVAGEVALALFGP
ncbi:hypothetical protein [Falsiroseomonas sp. E2-1-a20]|uniref:hypothetical protein n=1 Tax=Falsiroseomonas sp. E2-1-a20 TaxID=3239300 RepID=UPI003F3E23F5